MASTIDLGCPGNEVARLEQSHKTFTNNQEGNMSQTGAGDKDAKRREYNRNAQRIFSEFPTAPKSENY